MVGKVIRDHMEGGARKLTVPGFGTFMRRESAQDGSDIIFVDLLRGDDKTLSELVEDRGGLSELEAMAMIDRFIFETRNAIERHGSATIEGFGTLGLDHKGAYKFNHTAPARPVKETAVQESLFETRNTDLPAAARPATTPSTPPPSAGKPAATSPVKEGYSRPGSRPQAKSPVRAAPASRNRKRTAKPSRMDTILIVAMIAAAIALVALVVGMSSGNMPFLSK